MFEEMFALYFPPIRTGRKSMQLVPRVENARNQSHECFAFAPDLLKIQHVCCDWLKVQHACCDWFKR